MKITTVGYGTTRNTGNYENQKLYLEAEIGEGEEATTILKELEERVNQHVSVTVDVKSLEGQKYALNCQLETIKRKILLAKTAWQELESQWKEAEEFLKFHGITPIKSFPTAPYFGIPDDNSTSNNTDSNNIVANDGDFIDDYDADNDDDLDEIPM
jgi:hypothetical protein